MKQTAERFDHEVAAAVQLLPAWTAPLFSFATLMAYGWALTIVSVITAGSGLLHRHTEIAAAMALALLGSGAANVMKLASRRARPETTYVAKYNLITNYSFPSGHSAGALLVYGLLAALAAHYLAAPWGAWAAGLLIAFIMLVGVSRIYLGAHFPTDVIGGWVIGGFFLWIIINLCKI